jgi:nucleotide-binding universal stress UspA family protein
MRFLRSILFATDFHAACQEAATEAVVRLASVFDSRVTLFHVVEPLPSWPLAHQPNRELATEPLGELAEELERRGVTVADSSIAIGPGAHTILRRAVEIDADLIVLGAGDHALADSFRVGPTTAAVMLHAHQPVLAARPGEPKPKFEKLLCPVDHSPASQRGLRNAIQLARRLKSQLLVLSIVPPVPWVAPHTELGPVESSSIQHDIAWREEFERFLLGTDFTGVNWTREIRKGVAANEIVAAAREHKSDTIVMGSTGRSGLSLMLMGSVTRRVLQQLPCSVLTVKQEDVVEQLFEHDLQHIRLLLAEGRALMEHGASEAAGAKFRQVLARNPFHLVALQELARAYEKLGQSEEAERCRRRAQKLKQEG